MKIVYTVIWCIVWPFFNLVHPCRCIGKDRIPEGAAIFCPNHTKLSDPVCFVMAVGLKNRVRVMAKAEFMTAPILGWLLKKAGVFAVDRGKADVGAIKIALKCLKDGEKLLLFPEGTRVRDGEESDAKTGAAMLSVRTGVPLVPVYIPAKKPWFRFTDVVIGEPYRPEVAGKKGTAEEYHAIANDLLERIYALGNAA